MKPRYFLAFFLILAFPGKSLSFSSTAETGGAVHEEITRDALKGLISEANLKYIVEANVAQDRPGSEGLNDARRHFGDEKFSSSLGYLDRERKRALNYALESDTDPDQRGRALSHFGEILHSCQDFYSRTNYIEVMLKERPDLKDDPYSIPLVDWQKVPDAYPGLLNFNTKSGNMQDTAGIVKDSGSTEGGKKSLSGKATYFQVAKELAIRETQRQWNIFETMIRNRCGQRAAAILAALKEASPVAESKKENEAQD